jgi:uncharacterized protein YdhG (YjbR/CyaY superfamily)
VPKPKFAPATPDAYINATTEPARTMLIKIRMAIRTSVPRDATETISYRIPAFKHKKVLVWYAAFATHCSLFPTAAVIADHKDDLNGYKISKGTVQFPLDKPIPIPLIKKLVKTRVAQAQSR